MKKLENEEVFEIAIDDIEPDPNQPRKIRPKDYLMELGNSIRAAGLNNPIMVRENPDTGGKKWMIVNGECRHTASVLVGLKTIKAVVRVFEDEKAVFLNQVMDNNARLNMTPMETVHAFHRGLELGATIEEMAEKLGVSVEVLKRDLPLAELPPELQAHIDSGKLPKEVGRHIATLPKEWHHRAWDKAQTGNNAAEMIARVDAYKAARSQQPLFGAAQEISKDELQEMRTTFKRLRKTMENFVNSGYGNGKAPELVKANSKMLPELEFTAKQMMSAAKALQDAARLYRAASVHGVA
jgi:ParB family chromosome partitioning protein